MQYIDVAQKIQSLISIMDDWGFDDEVAHMKYLLDDFDTLNPPGKILQYKTACIYFATIIRKKGINLTLKNIPK